MIAAERFSKRLRVEMFRTMLRQEIAWFDRPENSVGALTTSLSVDPTEVNKVRLATKCIYIYVIIISILDAWSSPWFHISINCWFLNWSHFVTRNFLGTGTAFTSYICCNDNYTDCTSAFDTEIIT